MKRDPRVCLEDANLAAGLIEDYVARTDLDGYLVDLLLQSGIERELTILGRALLRLKEQSPAVAARIPDLQDAIDLRNDLARGFQAVNLNLVWKTALEDVPRQRRIVQSLLAELDREADAAPEPHLADDVPAPS